MRNLALAGLLAGVCAPGVTTQASAAGNHPAPATSNKGGDVRGTARADERAGDHGDQGRDRAEANQTKTKAKSTKDTKTK
jgi:hypothetical protein